MKTTSILPRGDTLPRVTDSGTCHIKDLTRGKKNSKKKIQKKKFKKKIQKKIKKNYKNYKKLKNPKTDTWQGS